MQKKEATVYSYKNSGESDNAGFITGSTNTSTGFDRGMAMTVESEVLPKKSQKIGTPEYSKCIFPF
jgi:hypothetical protein